MNEQATADAWMVRWTLNGCPHELPLDMFCTIPDDISGVLTTIGGGSRLTTLNGAVRLWLYARTDHSINACCLGVPILWPRPTALKSYYVEDDANQVTWYQFPSLASARAGMKLLKIRTGGK